MCPMEPLFGYRKGAFSGAKCRLPGTPSGRLRARRCFSTKLPRWRLRRRANSCAPWQERTVRQAGSTREMPVNVRLVASTKSRSRRSCPSRQPAPRTLYYRLQAGVLSMPPLRERSDDIPLLVEHFIEYFNVKLQPRIPVRGIEEDATGGDDAIIRGPGMSANCPMLSRARSTFGRSRQ